MKQWVGYILLALSIVIGYQGYKNSRREPQTEAQARGVACTVDSSCVLKGERPHTIRTDVIQRRYEWRSNVGPIVVVCRRAYIFYGSWRCDPRRDTMSNKM